jgi:predicted ArsR family transcriptional regulator
VTDSEQWESVGVLAEPARRRLYEYVAGAAGPVSREQAAQACSVPVHSVKFHLDKLASAGLLEVDYRRVSGRSGPGAGRPAKLYRRSEREVSLSVPPRRYDLVGEVLAAGVDRAVRSGEAVADAVADVARTVGREIGTTAAIDADAGELDRTGAVLADHGYEPREVDAELCLANCPFDRLAADHTELVCGINLALVDGVLDGLAAETLEARLAPEPGWCCVRVRAAT